MPYLNQAHIQSNFSKAFMQSQLFDQKPIANLHLDLLKGIDLTKYPPHRLHFLVYALQQGLAPPSESSMKRAENRNNRKSEADKRNQIRRPRLAHRALLRFNRFALPLKYGAIQKKESSFPRRGFNQPKRPQFVRIHRPARVFPKKSILLPSQVKMKKRGNRIPKTKSLAFCNHRPSCILEKALREKFREQIQNYYKITGINFNVQAKKSKVPLYFQKKKANQHRRRRQKHLLIVSNRQALAGIFGNAIFQKGWPVSRKQIKLALGIKQQNHMKTEFLGEFMEMAERKRELLVLDSNNNLVKSNKLALKKGQLSRMSRKLDISKQTASKNSLATLVQKSNHIQNGFNSMLFGMKSKEIHYHPHQEQFPSLFDLGSKKNTKK